MVENIGGGRALQICDLCGQVDDHSRHSFGGGVPNRWPPPSADMVRSVMKQAPEADLDRLLTELMDTGTTSRHRDCCRAAGCPTGECDSLPDLRGAALLEHMMKGKR
jgi:hypothetical protein